MVYLPDMWNCNLLGNQVYVIRYSLVTSWYDSGTAQDSPTVVDSNLESVKSQRSSTDSDLEAFSHNPTDGSFAPVAVQPSANTNYPNQGFLSY